MQLSFMSWVCPGWTIDEIASYGAQSPYDGIELRVDCAHAHGVSRHSSAAERANVRSLLDAHGLEIPCIATSHQFAVAEDLDAAIDAAKADVELAADLGARYIRVFAGGEGDSLPDDAVTRVSSALTELGEHARSYGVSPLLETKHDVVRTADDALTILENVQTSNVGVLWNQATISTSAVEKLADRINHVHVHDDVLQSENEDVLELVRKLKRVGYNGYISLEVIRGENIPPDVLTTTGDRLARQLEPTAD
jgi:sugar phosphate isomerase/epimerase